MSGYPTTKMAVSTAQRAQGAEPAAFWEALGGKGPVAEATDDASAEAAGGGAVRLLHLTDASGEVENCGQSRHASPDDALLDGL